MSVQPVTGHSLAVRPPVNVLGVAIDALTVDELHQAMRQAVQRRWRVTVLHVNAHGLNLACAHPWLQTYLNEVELVICDGKGVQFAAGWLGGHLPARITYADWMWRLAPFAETEGMSLYFLGGRPGVAQGAADRLRERCPNLRIAGCHHGYFDKTRLGTENQRVLAEVNRADPDILIVGFGMPLQERWLMVNRPALQARVVLAGGAVFDYLSGTLARGPDWMTQNGLEWLARLWIEPRRLWRRYLLGNPQFLCRVLRQKLRTAP